jgi:RNA 2',3'-cyclic 3'-phosphodiesterase
MRLFIGLNLPKKERQRIHRGAKALREGEMPVRWIDIDNYHITLKFLGDVRPERLPAIEEAITKVGDSTKAFATVLGGFGAFPTIRRPRLVWLGVDATPELRCLKQDLEWALGDHGFEAETRAFHPHIALGRADERGAGEFRGLDEVMAGLEFSGEVKVRTIDLMRSHLSKEGARYTVLSSAKLSS